MKNIILVASILWLSTALSAQAPAWDSSYKTTYYQQKVSLFRLLPNTASEIIFLGNSITDIGEWAEIWQNPRVKNRGISGDIAFGVLARLDEVLEAKPDIIFLMIGINDIARNIPDSVIIHNYQRIIERVKRESPRTSLVIQSILPTNNKFTEFRNHQNKTQHILAVNKALQEICKTERLQYIDLYNQFTDSEGKLDVQYTNDGLHLTGPAYLKWKQVIMQHISF